jgi:hypothetical protein
VDDILVHYRHRCTKLISLIEDIVVKEHFADNAHSDGNHVLIEVNDRAIVPLLLEPFSIPHHRFRVSGEVPWLKKGSHHFALSLVKLSFADEQPVAAESMMDEPSFAQVIGVLHQETLHMFSFVEQDQRERPEMKAADIAFLCHLEQEVHGIFLRKGRKTSNEWPLANKWNAFCRFRRVSYHVLAPLGYGKDSFLEQPYAPFKLLRVALAS